jgi:hypothetical protein
MLHDAAPEKRVTLSEKANHKERKDEENIDCIFFNYHGASPGATRNAG